MRALLIAALLAFFCGYARAQVNPQNVTFVQPPINAGDTAWLLTSSALVMIMTPGLAFFYGGLVRANFIVNTLMMNYICLAIVTVQWVVFGYSFAFGPGTRGWGNFEWAGTCYILTEMKFLRDPPFFLYSSVAPGLHKVSQAGYAPVTNNVPQQAHMLFQLFFAIITPALVSGAIVQRVKFFSFVLFVILWSTFVYDPLAHWVRFFSFFFFFFPPRLC
jgi:Amt family ammonium transporter